MPGPRVPARSCQQHAARRPSRRGTSCCYTTPRVSAYVTSSGGYLRENPRGRSRPALGSTAAPSGCQGGSRAPVEAGYSECCDTDVDEKCLDCRRHLSCRRGRPHPPTRMHPDAPTGTGHPCMRNRAAACARYRPPWPPQSATDKVLSHFHLGDPVREPLHLPGRVCRRRLPLPLRVLFQTAIGVHFLRLFHLGWVRMSRKTRMTMCRRTVCGGVPTTAFRFRAPDSPESGPASAPSSPRFRPCPRKFERTSAGRGPPPSASVLDLVSPRRDLLRVDALLVASCGALAPGI
mmetsp:Transcript_17514/g.43604  ORF Transcript_17514/g.43604 Transcript_17514/m.43604 type:complete len:291 (-) Transcript_17514:4302-5174(-)